MKAKYTVIGLAITICLVYNTYAIYILDQGVDSALNRLDKLEQVQEKPELPKTETQETISILPDQMPVGHDYPTVADWIEYCANLNQVDTQTVYAIIDVESGWNPNALSITNDKGLMQVSSKYWDYYFHIHEDLISEYGLTDDPYNEFSNILAGCNALGEWKRICESKGYFKVEDYLNAYNQGYSYFNKTVGAVHNYSEKVLYRKSLNVANNNDD